MPHYGPNLNDKQNWFIMNSNPNYIKGVFNALDKQQLK